MVEDTETEGDRVRLIRGEIRKGDHICPGARTPGRGPGGRSGRRITPQLMGSLAACGHDRVEVFTLPRWPF
jgi:molybdopterin biosynthesis enzyme